MNQINKLLKDPVLNRKIFIKKGTNIGTAVTKEDFVIDIGADMRRRIMENILNNKEKGEKMPNIKSFIGKNVTISKGGVIYKGLLLVTTSSKTLYKAENKLIRIYFEEKDVDITACVKPIIFFKPC
jgi:hypothetical protein